MFVLQVALVNLAQKVYPDRIDYVDKVLETTDQILQRLKMTNIAYNKPINQELSRLLRLCIDLYNILTILQLTNFSNLLHRLDYTSRKAIAVYMAMNILENETRIPDADDVDLVLGLLSPLIEDQKDQPMTIDMEDFAEEQGIVGRIVHLLRSDDADVQYKILLVARKYFGNGGAHRIKFVLPSLVFQAFQLTHTFKAMGTSEETSEQWNKKCEKTIQFCHTTIGVLAKNDLPELALRLYLQGALCIDQTRFENYETVAYDFMTQAFSLYEDEISDSKSQLAAITLIMSTFEQLKCFGEENAEPLRTSCALAASKLLKKPDQCRAVAVCAALFWSGKKEGVEMRDAKKTLDCLKRAIRIGSQCLDLSVRIQLYVEILNWYIFYFERGNNLITVAQLNQMIAKIREEFANFGDGPEEESLKQIRSQFDQTLYHIKTRSTTDSSLPEETIALFQGIQLE